jgi:ribosomal protein S17
MRTLILVALMLIGAILSHAQQQTIDTTTSTKILNDREAQIERNYNYYNDLYEKYEKKAKRGKIYTITGAGAAGVGLIMTIYGSEKGNDFVTGTGIAFLSYGFFSFNIGGASWVVNAIKADANKSEVEQIKRNYGYSPKDLTFGVTSNGIGLILNL